MSMPSEMIQKLLLSQQPQQESYNRRQKMIDLMRRQTMGGMEGQMVGKHYVGPHPITAGLTALTQYGLGQQETGLDNERKAAALEEAQTNRGYMDQLMMILRRKLPQTGTTVLPPEGMEDQ